GEPRNRSWRLDRGTLSVVATAPRAQNGRGGAKAGQRDARRLRYAPNDELDVVRVTIGPAAASASMRAVQGEANGGRPDWHNAVLRFQRPDVVRSVVLVGDQRQAETSAAAVLEFGAHIAGVVVVE